MNPNDMIHSFGNDEQYDKTGETPPLYSVMNNELISGMFNLETIINHYKPL